MADYELYVVTSSEHALSAESESLVDFLSDDSQCANCNTVVGFAYRKFFPCVVCIEVNDEDNEENVWVVCTDCAMPVINPGE